VARAALLALVLLAAPAVARAQQPVRGTAGSWQVEVWLATDNASFSFSFTRGSEELVLGESMGWETADSRFEASDPTMVTLGFFPWLARERAAYLASPVSFRDRALLRIAQIRANVERSVREGRLTVCDNPHDPARFICVPGPNGSHGMFDQCVHRPMTPAERDATLAAMRTELGRRAALVRANYRDWYSAVHRLAAGGACGPAVTP
jgi:hypothetical protein